MNINEQEQFEMLTGTMTETLLGPLDLVGSVSSIGGGVLAPRPEPNGKLASYVISKVTLSAS